MSCFSPEIARYVSKSPELKTWELNAAPAMTYETVIVIPALAESKNLFDTLFSLTKNPDSLLKKTLVIVVVNNRPKGFATDHEIADNMLTVASLRFLLGEEFENPGSMDLHLLEEIKNSPLSIAYVDAASEGYELPERGGVGLARKIGMDISLRYFDYSSPLEKVILCLDADTIADASYIESARRYFDENGDGAAVIPFSHRLPEDDEKKRAILWYEISLRCFLLGLKYAGSPYAYHSVGSTMAVTAGVYVMTGGMNRKEAGEDFYFLQKLAKYCGVGVVEGTLLRPSPRISNRVPFGTGRKMMEVEASGIPEKGFYNPLIFEKLKVFISKARMAAEERLDGRDFLECCKELGEDFYGILDKWEISDQWDKLRKNSSGSVKLLKHFHDWFDAFRTLRLVHELRDRVYSSVDIFAALSALESMYGCSIGISGADAEEMERVLGIMTALEKTPFPKDAERT